MRFTIKTNKRGTITVTGEPDGFLKAQQNRRRATICCEHLNDAFEKAMRKIQEWRPELEALE